MTKGLQVNTELSHYRIVSKIGEGGMGEVYLAQDTKLDRKVALKVLPREVVSDQERLRRFEQEARAASALNHPNILTIHEIGEVEGTNYISTEFVAGKTLRELFRVDDVSLPQALDIAIQVASALSAAHEAGIIHRDIKPENIMVRPDGLVKVLDFGLAKLSRATASGSEDATIAQVKTAPGVIMGTVQYMSPEQARGKAIDARSDIWSLGCVMYEMLGGRAPFAGETIADLIAEIVKGHPARLGKLVANIPERLEEIVAKTLEKDADERYQSVKDLLNDLRRLRKKLDLDLELDRSQAPVSNRLSDSENIATAVLPAAADTGAGQTTISGAKAISSSIKRHKFGAAAALVMGAVILAGFGYGLYSFLAKPKAGQQRTVAELKTQRLTGDGKTQSAVISSDGKFLAYKRVENEKESLWVKQIQTNSNIQVAQAGEFTNIGGLAFAPDGSFVYFNGAMQGVDKIEAGRVPRTVYKVPTLGGMPTKFLSNAYGVAFSSDGKQISFNLDDPGGSIVIANADGSNERKLASFSGNLHLDSGLAWSPDGKTIAVGVGDTSLRQGPNRLVGLISTTDGSVSKLGDPKWWDVDNMVWTSSGDAVLVVEEGRIFSGQIWEVAFPSGEARRLTNTFTRYAKISITADGKSLSLIESETRSGVWVSPNTDPNAARQILPANGEIRGIAWAPDGRIVYVSDQSGDSEIWSMNADGSNAKQLTNDRALKQNPVVSPDGRYIVYSSIQGQIFRIEISGGVPVQLNPTGRASGRGSNPDISPDSKWVLYNASVDGRSMVVRVPIGGGEPQRLYERGAGSPKYSPDGKYFAGSIGGSRIAIFPADGGEPGKIIESPLDYDVRIAWARTFAWTPDGRGIALLETKGERINLWVLPLDGSPPKQITNFDPPAIYQAAYSRDGKQIALVRGETTSNAVLMTGFR